MRHDLAFIAAAVSADGIVSSPCIDVCRIDEASGLCAGCWRTLDEIGAWSAMDAQARLAVWDSLVQRRVDHPTFGAPSA
jgi:predicted Fe-S protein YdhL (DUF1289 family)